MRYWEVFVSTSREAVRWGNCEVIAFYSRRLNHVALVFCTEHNANLLRGRLGVVSVMPAEDGTYIDDTSEQYQLSGNGTVLTPVSDLLD
jgi:hypothetical protein